MGKNQDPVPVREESKEINRILPGLSVPYRYRRFYL
jgi:hypothetical protein